MIEAILLYYNVMFNLPYGLLPSICWVESNWNPKAVNSSDPSYGLCQIKVSTATWIMKRKITKKDLMNPEINAEVAGKYLRYQLDRYRDNLKCAISAYNAGHCSGKNGNYFDKVIKKYNEY